MRHRPSGGLRQFWNRHSLSLVVLGGIFLWVVLCGANPSNSHLGAFFGNAIADWLGAFIIMLVTKYLHERGSLESRPFEDHAKTPLARFLVEHSLSLFLATCCIVSGVIFLRMDPEDKWGAVAGNILSQFVQLLALVLLTKKLFEKSSPDSKR